MHIVGGAGGPDGLAVPVTRVAAFAKAVALLTREAAALAHELEAAGGPPSAKVLEASRQATESAEMLETLAQADPLGEDAFRLAIWSVTSAALAVTETRAALRLTSASRRTDPP